MDQQLHTPEGVRDILNQECSKKLSLQRRMHHVLHLYGYQDIQTPSFEFYDVFSKEIGTIDSRELYKFVDRDGNILALRPDITPSIARAAAAFGNPDGLQKRFCYIGNTFINHTSYQGRLKEHTQLGAEMIGDDSEEADAEMIALVVDCLKSAGLDRFQVNVGNVDFFQSLMESTGLIADDQLRLRELIANRNYFGAEDLLTGLLVDENCRKAFETLPTLVGGEEVLQAAKEIAPTDGAFLAIERLESVYRILKYYEVQEYVNFDLSMSGTYGYYTGIVFRGYTFGTGDAVVKGGRYDHLLEKFGSPSASIGFAIIIDELVNALNRQKIHIPYPDANTLILYDESRKKAAVSLAKELRGKKKNAEILKRMKRVPVETYLEHGRQSFASSMVYLHDTGDIEMFNLKTGEEKLIGNTDR